MSVYQLALFSGQATEIEAEENSGVSPQNYGL